MGRGERVVGSTIPGGSTERPRFLRIFPMTELITLDHVVDGAAIAAPAAVEHRNPADPADLRIALPQADATLTDTAVGAATRAGEALLRRGIEQRADALAANGRAIVAAADSLALLIARETGKVLGDAKGEVMRAARIFDFFAGETLRTVGARFASTRPGVTVA